MKTTDDATDGLCALRRAAASAPLLSGDEELRAATAARCGDKPALDLLLRAHFRLVLSIARQFTNQCSKDELVSEGLLGLVHAARRFDPTRGTRFAVYAAWWIRAYMRQYTLANRRIVRAPSTRAARALLAGMTKVERNLFQKTGVHPDPEAIADAFGVDVEQVREVVASVRGRDVVCGTQSDVGGVELTCEQPSPETLVADADAERTARDRLERALAHLPSRERRVFQERHLVENARTLSDLGDEMGLSRERVRQLEHKAYGRLRRLLAVA
jgi:RNA polymerase sigma-32 factor